ncbi:MAG: hypothetical protein MJE66_15405 [Proteobacteria bacterium]|nr:hypothetical protein [Pseudomonadota bacterium]
MLWLIALATLAAAAASARNKTTHDEGPLSSGHPRLENVETTEIETYTVMVGQDEAGTWDWRAWLTTVFESEDEIDGLEEGQGFDAPTLDAALADARAWVAAELRGGPLGGTEPAPTALTRRGVRMSGDCSTLSVTDIEAWIDYAGTIVEAYDAEVPRADEVMRLALGRAFPECGFDRGATPSIRGDSWADVVTRVQSTIGKILAGELLSVEAVEDVVAARIVGMSVPSTGGEALWHVGQNNGNRHAIVVRPRSDSEWGWWVWEGPRGKWSEAMRAGAAPSKERARQDATAFADAYFNTAELP